MAARWASCLALLLTAPSAFSLIVPRIPSPPCARLPLRPAPVPSRAAPAQMFGGLGGGGFLNLGTPELVVIGAVAWALLGPKELYRLAREVGSFLGEWQQLGRQAQQTFRDAIDSEMAEDGQPAGPDSPSSMASRFREEASEFASKLSGKPAAPVQPMQSVVKQSVGEAPPAVFSDLDSAYANGEIDEAAMMEQLRATLGDPETNRANFAEQVSGDRNKKVLTESPAPLPGTEGALQVAEEGLLAIQIKEAENMLASLQAEKDVLALRRKQAEANAQRARARAEEEAFARRDATEA